MDGRASCGVQSLPLLGILNKGLRGGGGGSFEPP